ncbi:MAG: hypothetical protein AB1371_06460 [Pseudomonadota bacterium]
MERCHLKGEQGDRLHALLCAAGIQHPIRWLLRMIAKKGVRFLKKAFFVPYRCCAADRGLACPAGANQGQRRQADLAAPVGGVKMNISGMTMYPSGDSYGAVEIA